MKNNQKVSPVMIGVCSLLVILGVLCLAILSLLSLSTVLAEQRLAEANAQNIAAWYEADLEAQKIFGELRSGNKVSGVEILDDDYHYCVPVSEHQTLEVALRCDGEEWQVLRWQLVAYPEEINDTLPVWQGNP